MRTDFKIHSPKFPHHYPPFLKCKWYVEAAEGQEVEVVLTSMDIEETYDKLLVCDGIRCKPGNVLAKLSGENYS